MAIAYLTAGSTTMAAAAWSDATGFANAATLVVSSQTSQSITAGITYSSGIGQIGYLDIRPLFSGNIGTVSTPLAFGASTRFWNAASGGTQYVQASNDTTGGSTANTIALYQHSGPSTANLTGGTFTQIQVSNGVVNVGAGAVVTTLRVSGGTVIVEDNATPITTYEVTGSGKVICRRQITNATADGPSTTTYDDSGAVTTCTVGASARWTHLQGNITTAVFRGIIDTSGLKADATFGGTSLTWWNTSTLFSPSVGGATLTQSNVTNILGGYQAAISGGGGVPVP